MDSDFNIMNESINRSNKRNISDLLSPKNFPIILTCLYALCVIIGMNFHELWRDELDIYARVCYSSFFNMFDSQGGLGFESLIYYSLMKLWLTHMPSFAAYQVYHLMIMVAAVYVFNRYSSFGNLQKILFTFSYFMVFEYGIISRWYGFFVLLIFVIIWLLSRAKKNYILISVLLIVLANHTVSTTIFAASLTIYVIIHIINGYQTGIFSSEDKKRIIVSSAILGTGAVLIIASHVYLIINHAGKQFEAIGQPPFFMTLRTIWNSYVPMPDFSHGAAFWNTNILNFPVKYPQIYDVNILITPVNIFAVAMSVIFILICLFVFSRKPPVLITFVINTSIYFVFIHYIFRLHFIRHQGLIFIIFVYCAWLYKYSDDYICLPGKIYRGFSESKLTKAIFTFFITAIFFCQFLAGVLTYPRSIQYQFTKSWDAAKYIKTHNFDNHILVGGLDFAVEPIAIILNRDIYFSQNGKFCKIIDWSAFNLEATRQQLIDKGIYFLNLYNKKVIVIFNSELKDTNGIPMAYVIYPNHILLRKLIQFRGDIIQRDEQYFLYELIKAP
jgi:hypothetical protein